jgi:mannan endo-1,4-beta-mannosidase
VRAAARIVPRSVFAGTVGVSVLSALTALTALAGCGVISPHTQSAGTGGSKAHISAPAPTPSNSLPYNMSGLLDPTGGKFFGVEAQGAPALAPVTAFAASAGKRPDLIGQYVAWGTSFDPQAVTAAWSYGALYYIAWEPYDTSVQAIADGQSDGYITKFASAVRALNLPVVISFGHEMNGDWYPWGTAQTAAATFVAAWRHIHDLFIQAGASNVIWMWNPNIINPVPQVQLQQYWPGPSYVDWVGITGYFPTSGPETFASLYGPTITEVRQFTTKPIIIAETSVETGPSDVQAVHSLVFGVRHRPNVLGFIWFDYNKDGVDWQVESRPAISTAMSSAIASLQIINPKK